MNTYGHLWPLMISERLEETSYFILKDFVFGNWFFLWINGTFTVWRCWKGRFEYWSCYSQDQIMKFTHSTWKWTKVFNNVKWALVPFIFSTSSIRWEVRSVSFGNSIPFSLHNLFLKVICLKIILTGQMHLTLCCFNLQIILSTFTKTSILDNSTNLPSFARILNPDLIECVVREEELCYKSATCV